MPEPAAHGRPIAVVDIDGVLADVRHRLHHLERKPKDWDAFFAAAVADPAHEEGLAVARRLAEDHEIVFLTGRPERLRRATVAWLARHGLDGHELRMRPNGERRPAAQVKLRVLQELRRRGTVAVVVDDDVDVLAHVHAAGFPTFHADWEKRAGDEQQALHDAQDVEGRT